MTLERFRKILALVPLARYPSFHISCAYEPTLHPEFARLIELIPDAYRKRILLTTNLAAKLSDKTVEALSNCGFDFVNVSVESFDPRVYETCRRNAQYERFHANLTRLVGALRRSTRPPRIRFITLASSLNVKEIPSVVTRCATDFMASEHEVRRMIYGGEDVRPWINEHEVSVPAWRSMQEQLAALPHPYRLFPQESPSEEPTKGPSALSESRSEGGVVGTDALGHKPVRPNQILTFFADGRTYVGDRYEGGDCYLLDDISEPYQFFRNLCHPGST